MNNNNNNSYRYLQNRNDFGSRDNEFGFHVLFYGSSDLRVLLQVRSRYQGRYPQIGSTSAVLCDAYCRAAPRNAGLVRQWRLQRRTQVTKKLSEISISRLFHFQLHVDWPELDDRSHIRGSDKAARYKTTDGSAS